MFNFLRITGSCTGVSRLVQLLLMEILFYAD